MPRRGSIYDADHQRWRLAVLDRDGWQCRIRGPRCLGAATEADHIVDVADGGARLDLANGRAACKPCNSGRSARKKHREGWRRSATRIMLVVGPPGAGKSTYVREHAGPADVVVDMDVIAEALGSRSSHGRVGGSLEAARAARNAVLREIQRGELSAPVAWIVSANPNAERQFPHHEVVIVDPGREEVLRRCREAGRPAEWAGLVDDWYRRRPDRVGPSREW